MKSKRTVAKRKSLRKSRTRGWKKEAPKLLSQRRKLSKRCGNKCFLMPKELKFPICPYKSKGCKISCKGLLSAKIRSRQFRYEKVSKRATAMMKKMKC